MFTRIVKMQFEAKNTPVFLNNFEGVKEEIRNFPGCTFLELYRDKTDKTIFFTYSRWNAESDLENYRKSDLFKNVWSQTKALFKTRAEAWSVDTLHSLK
ncbi:antibiotic biosynthesis monooxygenase family protein [Aequorivita sp. SDUM287046]|uniref:Antibiotic biosynthesis monooxygenase family protein n=1 Tax=Aequorivita aurantiaca TaxID=3053356 RepID=A0ABT8DLF5_9FLAO|nr:antibiotic biosynthesis monooxygenase family protein [Aequorivita aurantiaca]MDN3723892.1 antibiotic biosynthesis monooxygenase family protein [Aequorivita aurantiaca]